MASTGSMCSGNRVVNFSSILSSFQKLGTNDRILAEYVWVDGSGEKARSKTMTLPGGKKKVEDLPDWTFDGSSTGQAPGNNSEVLLRPQRIFPDPLRGGDHILVMCDLYSPETGEPLKDNKRAPAVEIFNQAPDAKPWFGIEQEYTMIDISTGHPLGWPSHGFPEPQGPYYCGAGACRVSGREICEAHMFACLNAGIQISGINAEVMLGQWEYQVGPVEGIDAGDQLWMSRYLLARVAELFGVAVTLDPKPVPGDWNGTGAHTNYSTAAMRDENGIKHIHAAIDKLADKHMEHMKLYGAGNERRMTGLHETAPIDKFSFGVANRGASIRIPRQTDAAGKGYLEDRRPAANVDPYVVTSLLVKTTLL